MAHAEMDTQKKMTGTRKLAVLLRRWKNSLRMARPRVPTLTPTTSTLSSTLLPQPQLSNPPTPKPSSRTPTITSHPTSASTRPSLDFNLFIPTTLTIIHSPLDKRHRASNSSSGSTLRRSYLSANLAVKRMTAPAEYFSFDSSSPGDEKIRTPTAQLGEEKRRGKGGAHARQRSKLKLSIGRWQ